MSDQGLFRSLKLDQRNPLPGVYPDGGSSLSDSANGYSSNPEDASSSPRPIRKTVVGPPACWMSSNYQILITLIEATGLKAADANGSSDPYAVVTITQGTQDKALQKAKTRICLRNKHPMWEQSFLFPLNEKAATWQVNFEVYDKDILTDDFLGKVNIPLEFLLGQIHDEMDTYTMWQDLVPKYSNVPVTGRLHFSAAVVRSDKAAEVAARLEQQTQIDKLQAQVGEYKLQLKLHEIQKLRGLETMKSPDLTLDVKLGRELWQKKLSLPSSELDDRVLRELSIKVDDEVFIPLSHAWKGYRSMLVSKMKAGQRLEESAGEIKLVLKLGSVVLAATQIPIWSVPTRVDDDTGSTVNKDEEGSKAEPKTPKSRLGVLGTWWKKRKGKSVAPEEEIKEEPEPVGAGRHYCRPMELHNSTLRQEPELVASLQLTKEQNVKTEAVLVEDEAAPADVPSAKPLPMPEPLAVLLAETKLPVGANKLYSLLMKRDSEFMSQHSQKAGLTNLNIPLWKLDPSSKERSRTVTYTKPLSVPMGPKQADINEEQRVLAKEDGGFVVEKKITTTAPYGNTFYVLLQLAASQDSPSTTTLRASMKIEFLSSPMVKGIIQSQTTSSSTNETKTLFAALQQHLGGTAVEGEATAVVAAGPAAIPAATGDEGLLAKLISCMSNPQFVIQMVLMFMLLMTIWSLTSAVRRVGGQVQKGMHEASQAMIKQAELQAAAIIKAAEMAAAKMQQAGTCTAAPI